MNLSMETKLFRCVLLLIAVPVGLLGLVAAFGGLEAFATLLNRDSNVLLDPAIRNHMRAICTVFAGFGTLAFWSTLDLAKRADAFRITFLFVLLAGIARLTGWLVDGHPGGLAMLFTTIELVVFPMLFIWHRRLLRQST